MSVELQEYALFIAAQGLRILFSGLAMATLARYLGPDGLGRWAMITAAAMLLHLLFLSWMQQDPFVKFGREEWLKTGRMSRTWMARLPVMAVGFVLACLLLTPAASQWTGALFRLNPTERWLALAFLASVALSAEMQSIFQATGLMRRLALVPVAVALGTVCLYGFLFHTSVAHDRLPAALLGTVLITTLAWAIGGIIGFPRSALGLTRWDGQLTRAMVSYAWPMLPAALLGYIVNWANQVLLRRALTEGDVGIYQSGFQVHTLLMGLAVPLTTLILPKLIGKQLEDSNASLRYVRTIAPAIFALWLVVMIPAITLLPALFALVFGQRFTPGIPVLIALLVSTPLCALGQLYTLLYTVHSKMREILYISMVMVVIHLSLVWYFLPHATPRLFAQLFSVTFAIGQYLLCAYSYFHLKQPMTKVHGLLIGMFLFTVPQSFFVSPVARLMWGFLCLGLFLAAIRRFNVVERSLVERLFSGVPQRLQPMIYRLLLRGD